MMLEIKEAIVEVSRWEPVTINIEDAEAYRGQSKDWTFLLMKAKDGDVMHKIGTAQRGNMIVHLDRETVEKGFAKVEES